MASCSKGHNLTLKNLYVEPNGRRRCDECRRERANKYYHKNKVRLKAYYKQWESIPKNKKKRLIASRRAALKWNYGISLEEFSALELKQHNKCAICKNKANKVYKNVKKLDVDHSHKTGTVRGLLCRACNAAIGLFQEDKQLLKVALRYLEKSEDK